MGFLSNLKNNLTGSWAEVALTMDGPHRRGESIPVRVDIQVKDADITVTSVIVEVRCEEVEDARSVMAAATSGPTPTQTMSDEVSESLHHDEVILASAQDLAAGSSHTVEGQVHLPDHLPASARGRHAEFRWTARARLDVKGNDPDSGWTTLDVG